MPSSIIPPAIDLARLGRLQGVADGARVVVAMSGGVDSSVAAGLVKAAGYDAVGITLQLYDHGAATGRKGACCAGQDSARTMTRSVAVHSRRCDLGGLTTRP